MSNPEISYEEIKATKETYLKEELSAPDPDWPMDVRTVYRELQARVFEMGLEAQSVVDACGIGDNNIYTRYAHFTGQGIKEMILTHRLRLAKRLLMDTELPISKIAFAVGYENPSGFSATFKRKKECSPSEYRGQKEE